MINKIVVISILGLLIASCNSTIERLKRIGQPPKLAQVALPANADTSFEAAASTKQQHKDYVKRTNSLWQPGATTFFRDSRAWQVGDILKVVVGIKDSARLNNSTTQSRGATNSLAIPVLFGREKNLAHAFSHKADPTSLVNTSDGMDNKGSGTITRNETIQTDIAAIVTKVLPNGNLVIYGHQEVRVNYELREVKVAGIIRPKDISTDNSISSDQIAEARISYGGRGIMSDVQQPRIGTQVLDAISPF